MTVPISQLSIISTNCERLKTSKPVAASAKAISLNDSGKY